MYDIIHETRLSLKEAAAKEGVSIKTVQRWVRPTDREGRLKRSFLESFMRGGERFTSVEALERFCQVSQPANLPRVATGRLHTDAVNILATEFGIRHS